MVEGNTGDKLKLFKQSEREVIFGFLTALGISLTITLLVLGFLWLFVGIFGDFRSFASIAVLGMFAITFMILPFALIVVPGFLYLRYRFRRHDFAMGALIFLALDIVIAVVVIYLIKFS